MKTHPVHLQFSKEGMSQEILVNVPEDTYILYACLNAGLEVPHVCEQGWCLACAAQLISGKVDMRDAYLYYPQDEAKGFVLLCSAKPRSEVSLQLDFHGTRRAMIQHRLDHGLLVRAYPKPLFRRGQKRTDFTP